MKEINILSSNIVRFPDESPKDFQIRLLNFIDQIPKIIDIAVFPEYCWGDYPFNLFNETLKLIQDRIPSTLGLLLGTNSFLVNNKYTNNAIFISNDRIITRSKELILQNEKNQNVVQGKNDGIFKFNSYKIGVIICADFWNSSLVSKIVKSGADIILVPAYTIVPEGFGKYALIQWQSLSISRSREFIIPIVISDHPANEASTVGGATGIVDPSLKNSSMHAISDFILSPINSNKVIKKIDLEEVEKYRVYRTKLGIYRV